MDEGRQKKNYKTRGKLAIRSAKRGEPRKNIDLGRNHKPIRFDKFM
jgi:hypothetical protein